MIFKNKVFENRGKIIEHFILKTLLKHQRLVETYHVLKTTLCEENMYQTQSLDLDGRK
jgi:hypothetical protein